MGYRKLLWDKRGGALLEFAVVCPLLLMILFGIAVLGLSINTKIAVSMAAREAARYYAVNHNIDPAVDATTRNVAMTQLKHSVAAGDTEFSNSFNPDTDVTITLSDDGRYVTVKVTYRQSSLIPGLPVLVGGSPWDETLTLSSAATFKME